MIDAWREDLCTAKPGEARPRTFTLRSKSGEDRVVHFRPVTLPSGDQLVIYEDVTEQRRLQAQLVRSQKMEAVGTLASGVAHDFNNLLQAISGYAQLLGTGGLDARGREYLGHIERAADRAGELVRSLLAFSRKEKPRLRPLDLNHEVAQTVQILGRTIPKMVEIRTDLAPGLRPIQGDPTQIDQVLMNLATNARDAMPGGGVLRVETRDVTLGEDHCQGQLDASPGPHVLLRVSDTGCGMDAATLRHVFEPFFTTKPLGQGTGLGLSTVYGIVRAHGGHVTCRSKPGAGTAFEVYLPAIPPADARAEEPRPQAEEARGGRETVLIVDDEAAIRELVQTLLEARGYTVLAARAGEEALTLYRQRGDGIHLVLLDLGMPGMGGRACLAELLRLDPDARVVVASGYCADDHVQGALDAGATGFLGKPYRLSELSRVVREVLDRPQAR